MADTPAAGKKGLDFLTRKIGPAPVWVYALLAVGVYYWYTHYGPGASSAAAVPAASATPGTTPTTDSIGSNILATAPYSDDTAWASAAIGYLSGDGGQTSNGIGVPLNDATVAIDNYLQGLPNTAQQQAWVQLALNGIGPPPVAPASQVSTTTGGGTTTTPPPPPPPTPTPGSPNFFRETATGDQSLAAVAKARNTTVSHIEDVTRSSHGKGDGINSANLAKFNAYVAKGTSKNMPAGLVYYTTNPGGISKPATARKRAA